MADTDASMEEFINLKLDPCRSVVENMEMNGVDIVKCTNQLSELMARILASEIRRKKLVQSLKITMKGGKRGGNGDGSAQGAPAAAAAAVSDSLPEGIDAVDADLGRKANDTLVALQDSFTKDIVNEKELKALVTKLTKQIALLKESNQFKEEAEKTINIVNTDLESKASIKSFEYDKYFSIFCVILSIVVGGATIYYLPSIAESALKITNEGAWTGLNLPSADRCAMVDPTYQLPATAMELGARPQDDAVAERIRLCRIAIHDYNLYFFNAVRAIQTASLPVLTIGGNYVFELWGVKDKAGITEIKAKNWKKYVDLSIILFGLASAAMVTMSQDGINIGNQWRANQAAIAKLQSEGYWNMLIQGVAGATAGFSALGPAGGIVGFLRGAAEGTIQANAATAAASNKRDAEATKALTNYTQPERPPAPVEQQKTLLAQAEKVANVAATALSGKFSIREINNRKREVEELVATQAITKSKLQGVVTDNQLSSKYLIYSDELAKLEKLFDDSKSPDFATIPQKLETLKTNVNNLNTEVTNLYNSSENKAKLVEIIRNDVLSIKPIADSIPGLLENIKDENAKKRASDSLNDNLAKLEEIKTKVETISKYTQEELTELKKTVSELQVSFTDIKGSIEFSISFQPKEAQPGQAQQGGAEEDPMNILTLNFMVLQGLNPDIALRVKGILASGDPTPPAPVSGVGGRTYRRRKGKSRRRRTYRN